MQSTYKKALARKQGEILACQYGHKWPLNLHTSGYVKVIDSVKGLYIWADNKATLETVGKA